MNAIIQLMVNSSLAGFSSAMVFVCLVQGSFIGAFINLVAVFINAYFVYGTYKDLKGS